MRIKEFKIDRYGHIHLPKKMMLRDFNLFWGKNEAGKTLIIEALIKLLAGRASRKFENIDRIEENPAGYVVVQDASGHEFVLSRGDLLTNILKIDFDDFRNIFLIRNSDLTIADEEKFYSSVVDRLTGLNLEKIRRVKAKIFEISSLTPTFQMKNDEKSGKLKLRYEKAGKTLERIESLLKELQETDFERIELEIVRSGEELSLLKKRIEQLENARRRRKYLSGVEIVHKYRETEKRLKELGKVSREKEKELVEKQAHIATRSRDLEKEKETLKEVKERYLYETEKLTEKEASFGTFEEKRIKLEDIEEKLRDFSETKGLVFFEKRVRPLLIVSVIVFLISILGSMFDPDGLFSIICVISGIFAAMLAGVKIFSDYRASRIHKAFSRLKIELAKLGVHGETVEELNAGIAAFRDEYERLKREIELAQMRKTSLLETMDRCNRKIDAITDEIREAEKSVAEILRGAGVKNVESYSRYVQEKDVLVSNLGSFIESLKNIFPDVDANDISDWEKFLSQFQHYMDSHGGIEYTEEEYDNLKKRIVRLEDRLRELQEQKQAYSIQFREMEKESQNILLGQEVVSINSLADLERIRDDLRQFVCRTDFSIEIGRKAIEILEGMESERKTEISELLSAESPTMEYFRFFTDNLYTDILFDTGEKKIVVTKSDGTRLTVEKLSAGTYDQLYFAIRLGLAEKVLQGEPGFFILDDPFVKSDSERLERQLKKLIELTESGWQVLLFSAREEILKWIKKFSKEQRNKFMVEIVSSPTFLNSDTGGLR